MLIILWLIAGVIRVNGQNEFAANAFYSEFKKIYDDAIHGFAISKGELRESEYPGLVTEYKVKLMLPLADSGKIAEPVKGRPYVIYYFEPDKLRLKVDQKGANLRDAILIALDRPLYSRAETILVDGHPLTNTWYFLNESETRHNEAAFQLSIYYSKNKYYLSLSIRGQ